MDEFNENKNDNGQNESIYDRYNKVYGAGESEYKRRKRPIYSENRGKVSGILSMIFGILSIVLCCLPFVNLALAVVGLVLGIISAVRRGNGFATAGIITSSFGFAFAIIIIIFGVNIYINGYYFDFLPTDSAPPENLPGNNRPGHEYSLRQIGAAVKTLLKK